MLSIDDGDSSFSRDPFSKALVNTNTKEFEEYIKVREQNRKLFELEAKVNNMSSDLNIIKNLLTNLVDKK